MSRGTWLAAMAGLTFVGVGAIIAVGATSEPKPRPTPPRVYSSCLAADTKPVSADNDPCGGR
ncbi:MULTISPECIES: hypothetical protein [unclassified Streptomyces]|uniref:hypothetical protein n=1 Tax=unclassified Streptomyces TaxID=2593676 RepID=UPI0029AF4B3E|nr:MULTISPECIES: hypothetical protein [unclassified Streptomyces]MDX3771694.1 hypothetical protein [Streptomyces sp. AK08-01B]MDX3820857.1 hypothetical protein [Streptomyces sp. AK08-01A]